MFIALLIAAAASSATAAPTHDVLIATGAYQGSFAIGSSNYYCGHYNDDDGFNHLSLEEGTHRVVIGSGDVGTLTVDSEGGVSVNSPSLQLEADGIVHFNTVQVTVVPEDATNPWMWMGMTPMTGEANLTLVKGTGYSLDVNEHGLWAPVWVTGSGTLLSSSSLLSISGTTVGVAASEDTPNNTSPGALRPNAQSQRN